MLGCSGRWNHRRQIKESPGRDRSCNVASSCAPPRPAAGPSPPPVLAAPAIAQSTPTLNWRFTSSFPKSLDTLWGAGERMTKIVAEATDNKFQIRTFAAGEIVPGLQVLDAVQNGTVEMGGTASYYYFGKDPTFAFGTAVPFGLNTRQLTAWLKFGGGEQLLNDFYKTYKVLRHRHRQHGGQMGGWFRKEIKTVDDLKGLKMRIGGVRRPGDDQARRGAAADRRRRHLPGAREGHHRCRRMGRAVRRPEARLQQDRAVLLLSRLVGRQRRRSTPSSASTSGTSCPRATRRSSAPPARMPAAG